MRLTTLLSLLFLTMTAISAQSTTLSVTIRTGGDDLRGNDDNVDLVVLFRDGRQRRFQNVNRGQRWKDDTAYTVRLTVDGPASQLRGIRLETFFTGGFDGDNWNVDRIQVLAQGSERDRVLLNKTGNPLHRFTGEKGAREFVW